MGQITHSEGFISGVEQTHLKRAFIWRVGLPLRMFILFRSFTRKWCFGNFTICHQIFTMFPYCVIPLARARFYEGPQIDHNHRTRRITQRMLSK